MFESFKKAVSNWLPFGPIDQPGIAKEMDTKLAELNVVMGLIRSPRVFETTVSENRIDIHMSVDGEKVAEPLVSVLVDTEKNKLSIAVCAPIAKSLLDRNDPRHHGPYMTDVSRFNAASEACILSVQILSDDEKKAMHSVLMAGKKLEGMDPFP